MGRSLRPRTRTLYLFHICLADISPTVWRRLAVPGSFSLHQLHYVLQIAVGWQLKHLYEFEVGGTTYHDPNPDDRPEDLPDPRQAILTDLPLSQGTHFRYLYDFGDDWSHDISVEGVAPLPTGLQGPVLLGGARACPPEDVGGPGGYARFLEALQRPNSPEGKDATAWYGRSFDPEAWDAQPVTTALARMAGRKTATRQRRS